MKPECSTVTSKGQLVIPSSLRRRLNIEQGTKVLFLEERGRLILQPLTKEFVAGARGSLAGEPSLLACWEEEHRRERKRER